jgi:His-Xaa-Ser system protein HxsD
MNNMQQIILSKEIYTKEAITKASYLFKNEVVFDINTDETRFILNAKPIDNNVFYTYKFMNNLQEQQLRENLNKEFGSLRDKIYEKAFSIMGE